MIGSIVQGFLLIGVVYWYSKGMLTLINDYYRVEFKNYLEKDMKKNLLVKTKQETENSDKKDIDLTTKVEGLPDILNSELNSINCDGIVIKGADHIDGQTTIPLLNNDDSHDNENDKSLKTDRNLNKEETCHNSDNEGGGKSDVASPGASNCRSSSIQLLDSNESNYMEALLKKNDSAVNEKPILNPSEESKLDYEEITNQQVFINDDGKSTVKTVPVKAQVRQKWISNKGNCPANVGCYKNTIEPKAVMNTNLSKQKCHSDVHSKKVNNEIKAIANIVSCRRKTVNEMIQFWATYEQNLDEKN